MRASFPKVYRSFADFEREELHKFDSFTGRVDEMVDEMFHEELDFDAHPGKRSQKDEED